MCGLTSTILAANTPTVGTGTWTITSGTGGNLGNASSPTSTFSGTAGNAYTLQWTITNGVCVSSDDVNLTFNINPTVANAGPDQTDSTTCGLTTIKLVGNTPTVGTGLWTEVAGDGLGSFSNASSPLSNFTGTPGIAYTLEWAITNGACISRDSMDVILNINPTAANAGPDQTGIAMCGITSTTLAANTPTVGTGVWAIISGTGGSFGNINSPTSTFSGSFGQAYTLRWTITNGVCSLSDDVNVSFYQTPTTANAGSDQTICGSSTTLAGNVPAVGTGTWTVVSGNGTFT